MKQFNIKGDYIEQLKSNKVTAKRTIASLSSTKFVRRKDVRNIRAKQQKVLNNCRPQTRGPCADF